MSTVVPGVGNSLLSDEGVGIHVKRHLNENHSDLPNTDIVDAGALSFTLAGIIEDADNLIVVDAIQLNDKPEGVRTFVGEAIDSFLSNQTRRSVHEVDLIDLLSIARLANHLPVNRALIGIQPQKIDWGEIPTEENRAAIPVAGQQAINFIQEWRHEQA